MATATDVHHEPHDQHKPERIAPKRCVHAPYELYAFYEVWQKSGKESVPRSEPVWLAENLPHGFSSAITSD